MSLAAQALEKAPALLAVAALWVTSETAWRYCMSAAVTGKRRVDSAPRYRACAGRTSAAAAHHRRHLARPTLALPRQGRHPPDARSGARDALQLAGATHRRGPLPGSVRRQRRAGPRGAVARRGARRVRRTDRGAARELARALVEWRQAAAAQRRLYGRPDAFWQHPAESLRRRIPGPAVRGAALLGPDRGRACANGPAGWRAEALHLRRMRGASGPASRCPPAWSAAQGEARRRGRVSSVLRMSEPDLRNETQRRLSRVPLIRSPTVMPTWCAAPASIFDRVVVAIAANSSKAPMFSLEARWILRAGCSRICPTLKCWAIRS